MGALLAYHMQRLDMISGSQSEARRPLALESQVLAQNADAQSSRVQLGKSCLRSQHSSGPFAC